MDSCDGFSAKKRTYKEVSCQHNDPNGDSQTFIRCLTQDFDDQRCQDDGFETATSIDQAEVEDNIKRNIEVLRCNREIDPQCLIMHKELHLKYLKKGLQNLPSSLEILDCSRPWLCYWMLHSIEILKEDISEETKSKVIGFLSSCQHPDGGFGGGPGQEAHLAPTYAAVNALCILRCEEAYNVINREKLLEFLLRLRKIDGSFKLHEGSETDIRGVYCALSVAMLTSVWCDELIKNTAHWVSRCQTYEGGFGGVPDMEAHGGYTFCGLASLVLLQEGKLINHHRLLRWLVNRQTKFEGGFQGRTNKLVDSCYSFWQGGCFPLLHRLLAKTEPDLTTCSNWLFHQRALQEYLLIHCQAPHGGLIDKPGKSKDYYHTCYALSGLSVAQHFNYKRKVVDFILGPDDNELLYTHPIYNICVPSAVKAINYFQGLPFPKVQLAKDDTDSD
ncbi:hypothetical protein JTE90_021320 [Oedothorax gibbosus]|uniref:Protein farnesyltransferase subunit beta n=1 Tax=Oedothorax gibbosus TaxID=931172 RepID=A0AAV6VM74_9ARAC|nr:hypothetical protein JTE90_021320 [Oedothorax gibbosus]